MAGKNKYMNYSKNRHGRRFKKSAVFVVAVLCVVLVAGVILLLNIGKFENTLSNVSSPASSRNLAKTNKGASSASGIAKKVPGKTTNRIVVLMYHSINHDPHDPGNILRIPKVKFAAQMKWLYTNGYKTLSLDELYDAVSKGKPVPEKSVVLTFDDGYRDNYTAAFPVIKQYHFKATVFMITSKIGDRKNGYLSANELKEMDNNGFSVESHTVTHSDLSSLSYARQYKELSDSKSALQALLGHSIDYIAYPSGYYNNDTIKAEKKIGYKMCFREKGGMARISDSRYEFPRAFVGENLKDFIRRVKGTANYSM